MDEKVEKLIALAGNKDKYQYFVGILTLIIEVNVYLISVLLPFLEEKDSATYTDETGKTYTEKITYEVCKYNHNLTNTITDSWVMITRIECDEFKTGLLSASSYAGSFLGSFVLNILIDKIGRKKTTLIGCGLYSFFVFIITFCRNYYLITLFNFLISFSLIFPICSIFMLTEEITENKLRGRFFIFINCSFALSGTIYTIIYKIIYSWRAVFYLNVVLELILIGITYRYVFESPRFFLMHNDFDNAIEILKKISKVNGKDQQFLASLETDEVNDLIKEIKNLAKEKGKNEEEMGLKALIGYPSLSYLFYGACFTAFSLSFLYNGVIIQVKNFYGDLFTNALVFYMMEIVANIVSALLLNMKKLGRKGTILLCYVIGLFFFICLFICYRSQEYIDENDSAFFGNWKTYCILFIKITAGSVYDILYFYLIEVFPTPVRGASYSYNCAVDYLGAFLVQFCAESWKEIYVLVIYFIFSLGDTAIMYFIFPETFGKPLPETIKELDNENRLSLNSPLFKDTEEDKAMTSTI